MWIAFSASSRCYQLPQKARLCKEVENATAVVVSILVRNDADPNSKLINMALTWEAEFLISVHQWAAENAEDLVISFQAEVYSLFYRPSCIRLFQNR
ncbi:unnamed protein product [Protopolystoma xenopodis]|uniref:NPC1 middle luminal domain-containing protein n=1 Tax=Protopolystoma xenopodis TaxID=117903 RepID=A0A448WJE3_9PLAT|nr:unnamed protein product [Protopolystoma xenopodis]